MIDKQKPTTYMHITHVKIAGNDLKFLTIIVIIDIFRVA